MIAYDRAYPNQISNATVPITVIRNQNAPVLNQSQFRLTIPENTPLGSSVIQLTATDQDMVSEQTDLSPEFLSSFFSLTQGRPPQTLYLSILSTLKMELLRLHKITPSSISSTSFPFLSTQTPPVVIGVSIHL